jgi:hypothetical protein
MINEHLKNIYESTELEKIATIRKFQIVKEKGTRQVNCQIDYYNLDAINVAKGADNAFLRELGLPELP